MMFDNTFVVVAGVAGLHYAATAYVAAQAKKMSITTAQGEKLVAVGHVSSLHIYPVKSFHRMKVDKLNCTDIGPCLAQHQLFDRHFMAIKANGRMATLTEFNAMTFIQPRATGQQLLLDAPGMPTLHLPTRVEKTNSSVIRKADVSEAVDALRRTTDGNYPRATAWKEANSTKRVYGQNTYGIDCGDEAGRWISKFIGRENMRLLFFDSSITQRLASGSYLGEVGAKVPDSAQVAYSNTAPFNILSEPTMDEVNQNLKKAVSIHNFRPNIVVQGCTPSAEDSWDAVQIGSAIFRTAVCTPRCPRTTVDPKSGIKDPRMEPLKTLRTFRPLAPFRPNGPPMLGVHMTLEKAGQIRVGDIVYASTKVAE